MQISSDYSFWGILISHSREVCFMRFLEGSWSSDETLETYFHVCKDITSKKRERGRHSEWNLRPVTRHSLIFRYSQKPTGLLWWHNIYWSSIDFQLNYPNIFELDSQLSNFIISSIFFGTDQYYWSVEAFYLVKLLRLERFPFGTLFHCPKTA